MKCYCGLPIVKSGGSYPDCYDSDVHVSFISYLCSDGHQNCVSRLTPDKCPVCNNSNWDYSIVGNDNSMWLCGCGFTIVQTGVFSFWIYQADNHIDDVSCPLCSASDTYKRDVWLYPVYDNEYKHTDLKMPSVSLECSSCSAHWYDRSCVWCGSRHLAVNQDRINISSGRDYAVWYHECKCLDCARVFNIGSGWSD